MRDLGGLRGGPAYRKAPIAGRFTGQPPSHLAYKAAIKAGWHTQPTEREALVREVLSRDDIKYCPHGRPVCIELTKKELEKQFKRT